MAAGLLSLRARLVFFLLGFAIICLNSMAVSGARAAKKPRWSMEGQVDYEGPYPNPGHDPRVPPLAPLERFRPEAPSRRWQFSDREEAKVVHGGALAAKKPRWSMERQDDYEGPHLNPGHDPRVPPLAPLERFRPEAPSRRWQFSGRLP